VKTEGLVFLVVLFHEVVVEAERLVTLMLDPEVLAVLQGPVQQKQPGVVESRVKVLMVETLLPVGQMLTVPLVEEAGLVV
jgi:hypothetical protein